MQGERSIAEEWCLVLHILQTALICIILSCRQQAPSIKLIKFSCDSQTKTYLLFSGHMRLTVAVTPFAMV